MLNPSNSGIASANKIQQLTLPPGSAVLFFVPGRCVLLTGDEASVVQHVHQLVGVQLAVLSRRTLECLGDLCDLFKTRRYDIERVMFRPLRRGTCGEWKQATRV